MRPLRLGLGPRAHEGAADPSGASKALFFVQLFEALLVNTDGKIIVWAFNSLRESLLRKRSTAATSHAFSRHLA